jgi:hypothetical protein
MKHGLLSHKKRVLLQKYHLIPGADPGFQVRGRMHLKKLRRAEGGGEIVWVFPVKNHDFTPLALLFK